MGHDYVPTLYNSIYNVPYMLHGPSGSSGSRASIGSILVLLAQLVSRRTTCAKDQRIAFILIIHNSIRS